MKDKLLNLLTALTALCAIVVTIGALRSGKLFGRAAPDEAGLGPKTVKNGVALADAGSRIGPSKAILTIVEFGDFECPACLAYAQVLSVFRRQYPREVALVYRHMPLTYHKLAYPLARASECAAQQGRFEAFYHAVMEEHAELGLDPVARLVALTGVPDQKAFKKCTANTDKVARVDDDLALALQIGVRGTPGIIIGDTLYATPPTLDRLKEMLTQRRERAGR